MFDARWLAERSRSIAVPAWFVPMVIGTLVPRNQNGAMFLSVLALNSLFLIILSTWALGLLQLAKPRTNAAPPPAAFWICVSCIAAGIGIAALEMAFLPETTVSQNDLAAVVTLVPFLIWLGIVAVEFSDLEIPGEKATVGIKLITFISIFFLPVGIWGLWPRICRLSARTFDVSAVTRL